MKTYKNISYTTQLDIEPGQTGERDIPKDQEDRMVERGAIEVIATAEKVETPVVAEPETPADPEKTPEEIEAEKKAADEAAEAERKAQERRSRPGRS